VAGRIPSLEESIAQGGWLVGTADEVGDRIAELQRDLSLEHLTLFPHFPGMVREQTIEQLERFANDIKPRLVSVSPPAAARA
jgi:alkanesulfonate monooxygenase SsuD/methylene tetrahydromethanopterin reductase-like flavin-dependent oxidoreductase (luciferase family)